MGLKHYKNLTWQTKGRHDECTDSPRARLTDSTTLLQHPPPKGLIWSPLPNPWRASSGTELDNGTNQDSKPPTFFLTAVTRNLAIARFLCENSGPFWTTTRVLPAKYKINDESPIEIKKFAKKIVHILGKLSFHWLFIVRNCYTS